MKLIRCELPDYVYHCNHFKVKDYRDFILIRNDIETHPVDKRIEILDEMLGDLFPDVEAKFRSYVFINAFTSSIGKTKIPLTYTCPDCGTEHNHTLNLETPKLEYPSIQVQNLTLHFDFPEKDSLDLASMFLSCIRYIEQNGKRYEWAALTGDQQSTIINAISIKDLENIIKKLNTLRFVFPMKCKNEKCGYNKEVVYNSFLAIFSLIINPDEIFTFYPTNHSMVHNNYTYTEIMEMMPVERSIILSLIEKEKKGAGNG